MVGRLLTATADVNSGRRALQAAARAGNLEVVERLLTAKFAKDSFRSALSISERNRDE